MLRIDDTDLQRSTKESEEGVLEGLRWLNIKWDEGPDVGGPYAPYRQMERQHTYRQVAEQLMAQGDAYHCYCTLRSLRRSARQRWLRAGLRATRASAPASRMRSGPGLMPAAPNAWCA